MGSMQLKGRPYSEMEAVSLLSGLLLLEKRHCHAKLLSGGQKRKLCVAIALIGGSEVCVSHA